MTVKYNQNGYVGQSMSVRAVAAYADGEMPASKITAKVLVDWGIDEPIGFIKFLIRHDKIDASSWHHTGKYANRTNFYSHESVAESLDELKEKTFWRGNYQNRTEYEALKNDYSVFLAWKKQPKKWWLVDNRAIIYGNRPVQFSAIWNGPRIETIAQIRWHAGHNITVKKNGGQIRRPKDIAQEKGDWIIVYENPTWADFPNFKSAMAELKKSFRTKCAEYKTLHIEKYGKKPSPIK